MDEKEKEKLSRKVHQLRTTNSGLMGEIEQYGGQMDVAIARLEHLIGELVDLGILTTEQMLIEAEKWERSLRTQLIPVRDRLREAHEQRLEELRKERERRKAFPLASDKKDAPKLILP